jgi:hypothetical protein
MSASPDHERADAHCVRLPIRATKCRPIRAQSWGEVGHRRNGRVEDFVDLDRVPIGVVEELVGEVSHDGMVVPVEVRQHPVHVDIQLHQGHAAAASVNYPWLSEECADFAGSNRSPGPIWWMRPSWM